MSADSFALRKLFRFSPRPGPVVVCIMDGVGLGAPDEGNAVHLARKPTLDRLMARCPWVSLQAHGTAVGMPSDADMGNSEVGHNAMGCGRVFDQGAKLVNRAIASGDLFRGELWRAIVDRVATRKTTLHFIGLLSDGNVHSHIDQLFALLRRAAEDGVRSVRVHPLLDGRDVPETSALLYVDRLEKELAELRAGRQRAFFIASGGGRMKITMDRYGANWPMVKAGWDTHVRGEGRPFADATSAITALREESPAIIDQDLPPFVIAGADGKPVGPIADGDAVVLFNFRGDRAIEISRAFEEDAFAMFDRGKRPEVLYAGMMEYDGDTHVPRRYLVEPPPIERTLGEHLARNGVTQLAISETQKFGHVTYFWNGNRSGCFDETTETYVRVDSDLRPFDERPWMKAAEITDRLVDELRTGRHRHARLNFANGDMVGHTGHREATVTAIHAVDLQLARIAEVVRRLQGVFIVTADHGNADEMYEADGKGGFKQGKDGRMAAKTSHTLNPVPCVIYDPSGAGDWKLAKLERPRLSNLTATIANFLGYRAPDGYDPSLIDVE